MQANWESSVTIDYVWTINSFKSRLVDGQTDCASKIIAESPLIGGSWKLQLRTFDTQELEKHCALDMRSVTKLQKAALLNRCEIQSDLGKVTARKDPTYLFSLGWTETVVLPIKTLQQIGLLKISIQIRERLGESTLDNLVKRKDTLDECVQSWNQSFDREETSDVVFLFKNSKKLFVSKKTLSYASDYFQDMFESGFIEGTTTLPSSPDSENEKIEAQEVTTLIDSDIDSDGEELGEAEVEDTRCLSGYPKISQVPIQNCSFRTFRAVLSYLMTGTIEFAPLTSSTRADLHKHYGKDPGKVFSAKNRQSVQPPSKQSKIPSGLSSPKSVFVLADVYRLPKLKAIALEAFKEELTSKNVVYEFFSNLCEIHFDIRATIVEFILVNWAGVRASQAWKNPIYFAHAKPNQLKAWEFICARLSCKEEAGTLRSEFAQQSKG